MARRSTAPDSAGHASVGDEARGASAGRLGYRQIATELIREVHAGVWPVGAKLPTEQSLVDRFGVSRNTVREALRELRDYGYLSKRRGTPSVIVRAGPDKSFLNSIGSVGELLEYASQSHNTVLSAEMVILMDDQAEALACAPGSQWLRMQMLRRRTPDELPFCYSEVFVDPAYAEVADMLDPRKSIYAIIEETQGVTISRVRQEVEAGAASDHVALRLQVPPGAPILVTRTRFQCSEGKLIEIGVAHFAMGRYRLRIALDRRDGAAVPA